MKIDRSLLSCYENVLFSERPSSGRPGSPLRYFDGSYDVLFHDGCEIDFSSESNSSRKEPDSSIFPPQLKLSSMEQEMLVGDHPANLTPPRGGNQVVHLHLNELCVVTAGNVLEKIMESKRNDGGYDNEGEKVADDVSIRYLVNVERDSVSAKGKLRAKNKKQKRQNTKGNEGAEYHNGNVSPETPLCRVTLSDGTSIELKCCVAGTVIELNRRLDAEISGAEHIKKVQVAAERETEKQEIGAAGDPRLIFREPLLDGYLAVIMPLKGSFPPKKR